MGKEIKNADFQDCLERGKITQFSAARKLVEKELKTAWDDLKTAMESFKSGNDKWATVQAYYSMFHAARALLYSRGFREKSHYCLTVAMKAIFVHEKTLDIDLVEALSMARVLRENADYQNEYSKDSAKSLIKKAERFLHSAKQIVGKK